MFIDFLLESFSENRDNEAIIWNDRIYTYGNLLDHYYFWTDYLQKNVEQGNVVGVKAEYNPVSIALFLALLQNRNIIVPFSPSNKGITNKLSISEAEFYFEFEDEKYSFTQLDNSATHPLIKTIQERKHPGIIIFSSGSTGEPKAALHDFTSLLNKFKVKRNTLRTLNFLLFDHWGGINTMFYILSNNGVVAVPKLRTPDKVCEFIEKFRIELLPTTPTFLNLILLNETYKKYDLSSLKMITYGTEPMHESTLIRWHNLYPGIEFKQTYGLTELGVMRTKSRTSDSLWLKVGGEDYQTKVKDGVLFIKAKTSILGYLNAGSPFDDEGWYNTGDRVEVDGEWIRFKGRESDIINVGGEKVFPAEVESVILQIPGIVDCSVRGEKNMITGNIVVADVVLNGDWDKYELSSRIRQFCKTKLENYKVPVKVNIVDKLQLGERFKKIRSMRDN